MKRNNVDAKGWFQSSYLASGLDAQRRYPNEELLRFMGRNLFSIDKEERSKIKILEIGCGSCANLWMVSKEGFDAYGIDISSEAINLGSQTLSKWGINANLETGSMTDLPYPDSNFDIILDVFSSYCLSMRDFEKCLSEVARVLKDGGIFFTYTPGKESDAFKNPLPSKFLDSSTLDGIHRKTSPFFGNTYPFRFIGINEHKSLIEKFGFKINYLETVTRTYSSLEEQFEHVIVECVKK